MEITGPDGAVVTFPDDMPMDQVNAAMAKAYPQGQDQGAGEAFARSAVGGIPIVGPYLQAGGEHLAAWGQGKPYAEVQAGENATAQAHPYASTAGSLAGGIGGGAAEMMIPGAQALGPLVAGVGMGAGDAAVRSGGDPTSTLAGGALGLAGGVGGKALGAVAGKVAGALSQAPKFATAAENEAAKSAAYNAADAAGVMYSPNMSNSLAQALRNHMAEFGYDPGLQPGGAGVLSTLDNMDGQNVTLKGVDTLRKVVNRMGGKGSTDSGQQLAGDLRNIIDDRLANPQPGDVLGGDQQGGVDALNEGRRLAQIGFKIDDVDTAAEKATDQAATAGLGGNERNKLAQAMVKMKYGSNNWSPDELTAIQGAITPKPGEQLLRTYGKLDPMAHGGVALAEAPITALVGYEGGWPAVAAWAANSLGAHGARRLSDAMMRNSVNNVRSTILNGGVNPYAPNVAQRLISQQTPNLIGGGAGGALQIPPLLQQAFNNSP